MNFIKILFRSKKMIPVIFVIICFLVVQAYCELELPHYTSNIVDVGIMQGGIENAVPDQIREKSLSQLSIFMTKDDYAKVTKAYKEANSEGIRVLKSSYEKDKAKVEKLNKIFMLPMLIVRQANAAQAQAADPDAKSSDDSDQQRAIEPDEKTMQIVGKIMSGQGTDDDIKELNAGIEKQMKDLGLGDTTMQSAAVEYVRAEYEEVGVDMAKLQRDYMIHVGLIMCVFTLIAAAAAVLTGLLASIASAAIGRKVRRESFHQILSYSNEELDKFSSASLITRSTNDIQQVQQAGVFFLRLVLFAPAMAVGGIIMVSRTDTGLSWVIVASILVLAAVIGILLGMTYPKFRRMQTLVDGVNLVSREILTGLPVIRAFCREDSERLRFDEANTKLYKTQLFTNRAMGMFFPIVMFIMNLIMIAIVWFGGHGVDNGDLQVGDLMAFMSYTIFIVMSFMMLSMVTIMLPRASVAAERILDVINTKSSIVDAPGAAEVDAKIRDDARGEVVFKDVSFRYHNAEQDTLSHISFTANPGETTAIIGGTGSGKSTLVNLVPRLFDVTDGSILIDGTDIRDMSQSKLRSLLGVVPQKGMLFSGTVESNLKYAGDFVTDDAAVASAKTAQAYDFIEDLDGGFEYEIAQGGTNVSGGQRQRLAIARAIAKNPKIMIFDDSFSALDYKTDAKLRRALNEKLGGATKIIVAQRIATILHAEKILVLEDGEIVGSGTHKELLKTCEVYREIAGSQLSEEELAS